MKRRKNRLLQRIEYAAYRVAARVITGASEERAARWGTHLGALARHLLQIGRAHV